MIDIGSVIDSADTFYGNGHRIANLISRQVMFGTKMIKKSRSSERDNFRCDLIKIGGSADVKRWLIIDVNR